MSVFEREVLPNGLRLLTAPMPQVQSGACFIMLAAGSRYETPETSGIAHFAEHMFFKGTERRPTAQQIGLEKGVIIEEMNMYFDTPRDYISGVYHQLLFGDTPLGWDIIGRKETVRGATRETFLGYTERWYRAPRMVAGVAGNLGEGLRERLEEILG